jgi:LPXTG-motif cell wall-anchored protein
MNRIRTPRRTARGVLVTVGAAALLAGPITSAAADPVSAGDASAYGFQAEGLVPIEPMPTAEASVTGEDSASETLIEVPADPLAVSGTFTASAVTHEASDIESVLAVNEQEVAGPYNTQGATLVEGLDVLLDSLEEGTSLVTAEVLRSEAVGVCNGDTVDYSANSEIVNLQIGGEDVPLNGPLEEIVAGIDTILTETTLDQVVDIDYNVVEETADGISVDALVITVLAAAGEDPVERVTIGHAETGGLVCGAAAEAPECSDGADNDGDGVIDHPDDPGCDSPEDDSEVDAPAAPECSDGIDNDGDGFIDFTGQDPGCDSPEDDSEIDGPITAEQNALPRTGSGSTVALVLGAGLALGALALRRLRSASLT